MNSSSYPKHEQAIFLSYRADSVKEMAEWLSKLPKKYQWMEEPRLTPDLCRCIVKVWVTK